MTSTRPPGDRRLMTAGRFAEATLLSAKALRIYADRGLLPPRFVDPVNGYRYYADDQVRTGWLIALLRSADLSLERDRRHRRRPGDASVRCCWSGRSMPPGSGPRSIWPCSTEPATTSEGSPP